MGRAFIRIAGGKSEILLELHFSRGGALWGLVGLAQAGARNWK